MSFNALRNVHKKPKQIINQKESLSRLPKYFQPAATKSSDPATAMADDEQPAAITTTITQ
jgi:hypothetical protein